MRGLTPKARRGLDFIRDSIERRGIAPSYAEITAALDLKAKSGAIRILDELEANGDIRRIRYFRNGRNKRRAVELLNHTRTICPNCNHEFEPASVHLRRGETLDGSPVPRHAIEGVILEGAA